MKMEMEMDMEIEMEMELNDIMEISWRLMISKDENWVNFRWENG